MISFTLTDSVTGDKLEGKILITPGAIGLRFDGYGDKTSAPGEGEPIYLELHNGKLKLYVNADINHEDFTDLIDMSGAKESNREAV